VTYLRWESVRAGGPGATLAVDYGLGRREAGIPELTAQLTNGGSMLQSLFFPGTTEGVDPPDDVSPLIEDWRRDATTDGREVRAVLGFCAGASLAAALADSFARAGAPVRLVLLDPQVVRPAVLLARFHEAMGSLVGVVEPELAASAEADCRSAVEAAGSAPVTASCYRDLAATIRSAHRRVVEAAAERTGLPPDLTDEIVNHFGRVTRYLALAGAAFTGRWKVDRPAVTYLSRTHIPDLLLPAPDRVFNADRATFLGSPELAEAVDTLLITADEKACN
jgi:hypothetical protein